MNDQSIQSIRMKMIACWAGVLLFGAVAVIGFMDGEWLMAVGGVAMTAGAIAALFTLRRQSGQLLEYRPGKGFWYYRMTRKNKIAYLTAGQIVIIIMIVVFFFSGIMNWVGVFTGVIALMYIEFLMKRRIKYHTTIDDATLFELEELGIIEPEHIVNGLYKDFQSWNDAREGSKIIVLTTDEFIVIRMNDDNGGDKLHIRLRDINRIGIIANGSHGQGLILTIVQRDDMIVRFTLIGESFQDSPEQFVQQFLQTMDRLFIGHQSATNDSVVSEIVEPESRSAPKQRVLDI